jgi:hypothetical protein
LHGAPGGVPQTAASFDCETQNPSGPRQPGPPLQPQPLQRQVSWAEAVSTAGMAENPKKINRNTAVMNARMIALPP